MIHTYRLFMNIQSKDQFGENAYSIGVGIHNDRRRFAGWRRWSCRARFRLQSCGEAPARSAPRSRVPRDRTVRRCLEWSPLSLRQFPRRAAAVCCWCCDAGAVAAAAGGHSELATAVVQTVWVWWAERPETRPTLRRLLLRLHLFSRVPPPPPQPLASTCGASGHAMAEAATATLARSVESDFRSLHNVTHNNREYCYCMRLILSFSTRIVHAY